MPFYQNMSHTETDEITKLFDVLYRIDQRLSSEAKLLEDKQNEYGTGGNKNTRPDGE